MTLPDYDHHLLLRIRANPSITDLLRVAKQNREACAYGAIVSERFNDRRSAWADLCELLGAGE